jgi:hypothetical protein
VLSAVAGACAEADQQTAAFGAHADRAPTAQDTDKISADFLVALPDSIRSEVLAKHWRDRIRRRDLLDVPAVAAAVATMHPELVP